MNGNTRLDAGMLAVGDVVFVRVTARPFREVASATGCWTNHVGIVVETDGAEPLIAESTFPRAKIGPLSRFLARSEHGRVAVKRLHRPLSVREVMDLQAAARERVGIWYDTGFDLHSPRQFCSRFVREVLLQATGKAVGDVQTLAQLLAQRPSMGLWFWRLWYVGRIPWQRETVTPASLLASAALRPVFDSAAGPVAAAAPLTRAASCA